MTLLKLIFWTCAGLIVHTHVTYPLSLAALARLRGPRDCSDDLATGGASAVQPEPHLPAVSLIIAAHDEADVIAAKIDNALALDYPHELLELIVASDGSTDSTVEAAGIAGADLVLDLPRAGKISAQNAAVERARGEIVAFSDANSVWEGQALRELVAPFEAADVAYVCGQVRFLDAAGDNEEGAYWRYEMAVRTLESSLAGVTAGNGAIYAVRRDAYEPLPPSRSHDLSFPFAFARAGKRSVYAPSARAEEKMVPTLEGEFARKRRMMRGLPDIVFADRMYELGRYEPLFAYQLASHRLLRYATPLLHAGAFASAALLAGRGRLYSFAFGLQLLILAAAALAGSVPSRILAIPRYYVLTTASVALGCWDRLRQGPPAAWQRSEGTR